MDGGNFFLTPLMAWIGDNGQSKISTEEGQVSYVSCVDVSVFNSGYT